MSVCLGDDRGARSRAARIRCAVSLALVFFALTAYEQPLFSRLRDRGFGPGATAVIASLGLAAPFLCPFIIIVLDSPGRREGGHALPKIAALNAAAILCLAWGVERSPGPGSL